MTLFNTTIFGPIHSRRLGTSLGINLTPNDGKICSFDCLYCEAGYNSQGVGSTGFAPLSKVSKNLEDKLLQMKRNGETLDVITFSGNGEPTLHPDFPAIIDEVIRLRDKYFPDVKISVLTNSTRIFDPEVAAALRKVDNNILKLDSAIDFTMRLIDRPNNPDFTVDRLIDALRPFAGTGIIQTMFLRGEHEGATVDNTTPEEIDALIYAYKKINPKAVMIYSIDRPTPEKQLVKVDREELLAIADKIRDAGIAVQPF